MLKCLGGYCLSVGVCGEEIFCYGATASDSPHIDFMKAIFRFLSGDNMSAVTVKDYDSGFDVTTFVFGSIDDPQKQVHTFRPIEKQGTTTWNVKSYDTTVYSLAIEVIKDIECDFKKWVYFPYEEENYEENFDNFLKQYHTPEQMKKIKVRIKENEKLTIYWLKKLKQAVKRLKQK